MPSKKQGLDPKQFNAICARINAALEVRTIIELLDFHPERAIKDAGLWRLFCPIHKDAVFRTLVLNPRRNTYHCEHTACPAHQPGDFLELLVKAKSLSRQDVVKVLVDCLGPERLRLTKNQADNLREYLETHHEPTPEGEA